MTTKDELEWMAAAAKGFAIAEGLEGRVLAALKNVPGLTEAQEEDLRAVVLAAILAPASQHVFRHVERGTDYALLAPCKVKVPDTARVESDGSWVAVWEPGVIYKSIDDGALYVRTADAFRDGGFVEIVITDPPPVDPEAPVDTYVRGTGVSLRSIRCDKRVTTVATTVTRVDDKGSFGSDP